MNKKTTTPSDEIASQLIADLLRPLSQAEIEHLAREAIITHRRLVDAAEQLCQSMSEEQRSNHPHGDERYFSYVRASLEMHAQMDVVDTLINTLGFVPEVTLN